MEKHELYRWVQFIANCGGLLGLFMGFSIVSIIEIVYYILLFKSKKEDKIVNFIEVPQKSSNMEKNSKFINVSSISDDWKNMPKFEYLP